MLTIGIIALLILIDVIVFAHDRYDWSIGIMIVTIVGAYFFTPHIKDFIENTGWLTIFTRYVPLYIGVGLGTALIKWMIFSFKQIGKIREVKKAFDIKYPTTENSLADPLIDPPNRRRAFIEYFQKSLSYKDTAIKVYTVDYNHENAVVDALTPRANDNIGKISVWVFQWPIVIISTVFSDFLLKLSKLAAAWLDFLFSAFSRKMVAKATKGL